MGKNRHLGSSFDEFLEEESLHAEAEEKATKKVVAWQIEKFMEEKNLSKTDMAKVMKMSRAALNRLLDPENGSVTLHTLERAAAAVGKRLHIELVDVVPRK